MEPSSLSPGPYEAVNLLIDQYMTEAHFCAPAVVVSYNAATQSATVQPTLMRKYNSPTGADLPAVLLPQISNVPVVFPATATAWLRLPIAAGDLVMLHFSDRSLDAWWATNGAAPLDPKIPHKFVLADAIAVPGLRPGQAAIAAKGAATSVELACGILWLELMASGQVKLTNGTVDVIQALSTFATTVSSATNVGQIAGAAVILEAALAPFAGL